MHTCSQFWTKTKMSGPPEMGSVIGTVTEQYLPPTFAKATKLHASDSSSQGQGWHWSLELWLGDQKGVISVMTVGSIHLVIHQQQQQELPKASSWAAPARAGRTVRQDWRYRPSIKDKSHQPGHSTPHSLGRTPCWASSLLPSYGLRPLWFHLFVCTGGRHADL